MRLSAQSTTSLTRINKDYTSNAPTSEQHLNAFCELFKQVRYSRQALSKERKNQAKSLVKLSKSIEQRNL